MSEHEAGWYFSRGDAELGDKCPRARFNRTMLGKRGVVGIGTSFELSFGTIVHRCTEWVLTGKMTLSEAAAYASEAAGKLVLGGEVPRAVHDEAQEQFFKEAQALGSGLVWAWGLYVLPELLSNYKILHVEDQTAYKRDGFVLPTVADLILEASDGTLVYPDWKTAAWVNGAWMQQWVRSAQLHQTARAIEQVLGKEVEYCYVQALVKGRWQNGYQQSPLVWGYFNEEEDPEKRAWKGVDTPQWLFKHTARKKWHRTPQWLSGMSSEQWVRSMPEEIARSVVPRTQPIAIDEELAERWWVQHIMKETRYQEGLRMLRLSTGPDHTTALMDEYFPQHNKECDPVVGFKCDFHAICHDYTVGLDPVGSGYYRPRPTYQERLAEESAKHEA